MLFQIDLTETPPQEVFPGFWNAREAEEDTRRFAQRLVDGVVADCDRLDDLIASAAEHWRIERMAVVDRNVLRLAAYELLNHPETPVAVVIDEAIEIAKKYGSAESGGFINGVLDAMQRRIQRRDEADATGDSA
jgi:N utilization substance protein B